MANDNREAKEAETKPSDTTAFLAECRRRFQRCIDATHDNRVYQLDDVRFAAGSPDNGWQWPQDVLNKRMKDPNGARPTLTINRLIPHIKLITNEQRKNKPMGKVLPVDDKADIEVAEVLNGVMRHIEVASHADVAYDTACESQVTMGEGYWRILTDYCDEMSFEQDIRIAAVKNAFAVYMDPDGLKMDSVGRKCEYGFVTQRLPKDRYEQEFPKAKSMVDWEDMQLGDDSYAWFDDEGVLIAEYFYVTKKAVKIVMGADGRAYPAEELPEGFMPMVGRDGKAVERTTEIRSVKWRKINGLEVLEESDWAGKYIPLVRVVGNEWDVEGQLVTSGIVRNGKDPQRMINYWESVDAEVNALAPKAPFIGAVGQFEDQEDRWRDANTINFAYLEYNPLDVNGNLLPPPKRQEPPQINAALVNAKMKANDDLQSVIGQYNPSLGAEAQEKSGRAIIARQQQADVGTFHYVDNLSRSIGYSTEIILDLIPKIYDTRRVARIIGEDGVPDHATLSVGMGQAVAEEADEAGAIRKIYDPSVGRYDVVVAIGPSFATKRLESAEFLTQAAQAAKDPVTAQVISYLALKSQDWPEATEAAEMLKKLLPPQVLEDEDADENDPEVMRAQVQAAAQALGQREAAVQQATEQAGEVAAEATQQEAKAKDAMARAQAKVDEINAQQVELKAQQDILAAERRELALAQQLATANIAKAVAEANLKMQNEAMGREREMMDKREEELKIGGQLPKEVIQALVDGQKAVSDAVVQMTEALSAERETDIIIDPQTGDPIGSRSRVAVTPRTMQ